MKNRKVHNSNAPLPGCLGRMANLFDVNPGVAANKRLMDKPHYDGSSWSKSRPDVARSLGPIKDPLEDKLIISELRRNASDRTPMKMLIDHEMSKEEEPKQNPPSLVAKLMGLDTLPRQNNDSVLHRSQSKTHGTNTKMHLEKPRGYHQSDTSVSDMQRNYEADFQMQKEHKDIYEIWKQAQGEKLVRDVSTKNSRRMKDTDGRKMALVRQKFIEAKLLVTDEKLCQTKAFHNALEVLSANRDLFIKCLHESNSQFSQQLYGKYIIPVIPETQRITVLKPSKIEEDERPSESENKNGKRAKKPVPVALARVRSKSNDECSSTFSHWDTDDTLPARIMVLKPSIVNSREIGTIGSPNPSSLEIAQGKEFFHDTEVCDAKESREVANEITRHMRDKLMGRQSDETLFSSVFSHGYTGDESSMNKSDNEYDRESDSEVMSPTSRHSWDYINRFRSPFSSSSFSRASCSPESSVCREAKRRLSERWAMVALHANPPERRHVRRSSCTLGEMLALSDTKKSRASEEVGSNPKEARRSMPCRTRDLAKDDIPLDPSRSLHRSKSVPVSSSVYGDRLNVELSGPEVGKPEESREAKPKSNKVSFKGKVSSLFFSKNKKVKKEATDASEAENSQHVCTLGTSELFIGKNNCKTSKLAGKKVSEECIHVGTRGKNGDVASSDVILVGLSGWRTKKSVDNQDQPSPISVLEMPFGENDSSALEFANCSNQDEGRALGHQLKSCLIDKSPLIGSISRTIYLKDSYSDTATTLPVTPSVAPLESESEEDWFLFIQTLLADSGMGDEVQSDAFSTRWHSPDSPLDPVLREKYINLNRKAIANEANRRQWRSSCKLMYDCVNVALVDLACSPIPESKHRLQDPHILSSEGHSQIPLSDDVRTRIKEWINYDARSIVGGDCDSKNRLSAKSVVKNEVVGKIWVNNTRVEIDEVGKEIEEKLLEELVEDAVVAAMTDRDL